MKKKKVFVVGGSVGYANWLPGFQVTMTMGDATLVMFTGGEDINPALYGEEVGKNTYFNKKRDDREIAEYYRARQLDIPLIGICRGAQFLTAMSGGRLVQDQANPGTHPIFTWDGNEIPISSLHHQAMYPYELPDEKYKLIAWAENHSHYHLNGKDEEISDKPFKEAEIVYYPDTRALCIQGHPEMMNPLIYAETFNFLDDLVERLIDKTI